ncbi:DUF5071 domain-containing protein [Chengkuizengella axinellae]|uniref:DUF5071 domain-containing protein n=1 Tax=Chengkuizengella axinellae TaxID=3064388 RepID=A0ABT9IZJ7_9BACL|nr:DUF5071 domain-containing protein [Chengkuizengella sp. 2205SS18-9]MDP5274200.1 DUF5071 domain-containing protein [Chengkuizengella sp. 2205SS18-9]
MITILPNLMEWIQDMNWPIAEEISLRLVDKPGKYGKKTGLDKLVLDFLNNI